MPTPNLPQGITDPLDSGFQADPLNLPTAYNTVNGVTSIALPDARADGEPTAEWRNKVDTVVAHFADYVQGLTPITGLQVATFFELPIYTTAALPAASSGEGRVVYDTTTNTLKYSNGSSWVELGVAGVAGQIHVFGEGGGIDEDYTTLVFNESQFALTDPGGGDLEIAIGVLSAANLPASAGQLLTASVAALDFQTNAETDLMTHTLAANTLDANGRRVMIEIAGDTLNTGAGRNAQLRLYVGGVLVLSDVWAHANFALRKPWRMQFDLVSISQSVQATRLFLNSASATNVAPTVGIAGTISSTTGGPTYEVIGNDSTADRTGTIALRVSLQHDTTTANFRTRTQGYRVMIG